MVFEARLTPCIEVSFGEGGAAHAGIGPTQRLQRFER
jgi:hypothetical protein